MNIVVTGASGFIGASVIRTLDAAGHRTVALSRQPSLATGRATVVRWKGVDDVAAISRACTGADVVVHLAARVDVMRRAGRKALADYRSINVDGTATVARVAADAGVGQLVYLSTIKVHGEGGAMAYAEQSPFAPTDAYARSKIEAEEALSVLATPSMAITIIRPPLVFGAGVRANFARLIALARLSQRVPLPLGGIANARSLLYVDNLASAIERVAQRAGDGFRAFVLADDPPLSTPALVRDIAAALGAPARLWHLPSAMLRAGGVLVGRGRAVDRLLDSLMVDSALFRHEFAWASPMPWRTALANTVRVSEPAAT